MPENTNETTNSGSGQAVSIVVPEAGIKWVVFALLLLTALLIWTDHQSNQAELRANQAIKSSEDMQTEMRLAQFWIQRTSVACQSHGVDLPPIPASLK